MLIFYIPLRLAGSAWRRLLELDRPVPQRTEAEVGMIAPLLGGWLASASYGILFALSALSNLVGLLLLFWTVKEPRWEPSLDDILVRREGGC